MPDLAEALILPAMLLVMLITALLPLAFPGKADDL